jgi:TonB-linked SusC/RagA family outer membrane protein
MLWLAIAPFFGAYINAQQAVSIPETDSTTTKKQQTMEPGIYFPVTKERSSASVSSLSGELLYKTPVANLTNTLYGLSSGLMVQQGSGEPGRDAANLTIRGVGSFNYGSYAVFVDGFQTTDSYFQYLLPAEIESISILKDAAALAPFGMTGANGILWIETKKGRIGKPKIQAQFRTGLQQLQHITKPLQSYDYASLFNEAVSNDNGRVWNPLYSQAQLDSYKNGTGTNTDWYDETLKPSTPFLSTDLTFDGGSENARYFIMLGIVNNNGFYDVKSDDTHGNRELKQYNIRSNFDFKMLNIFEGKVNLGGRIEDRKSPAIDGSTLWNVLERYPNNVYPVKNTDGTWTGTSTYPNNPVPSVRDLGYYSSHDRSVQANFSLKEKLDFITPGLYLSEAASFSNWTEETYNYTRDYARYNTNGVNETTHEDRNYSVAEEAKNQWNRNQLKITAGYDKKFDKHLLASAFDYLQSSYNVDANQNGSAGNQMRYNRQQIAGRIHYEYDTRYTGEVSFAYSGADDFAKGNRFGFYPAISGAWILSNETFLSNSPVIDFLKARISAGKTAHNTFNDAQMPRYLYQQYYGYSGNLLTGNATPTSVNGLVPAYIATPDIFAEESMKYNFGVDAQLFKGLDITADVFMDKRSGVLDYDYSYLAVIGIPFPIKNAGKVTTSGVELDLNYHGSSGKFTYSIGGNLTYLKDKIDYTTELTPPSPAAARTGYSIGLPNGYEYERFYDVTDFNTDGTLKNGIPVPSFGSVQPGDLKYKDISNDNVIDERDIVKIGKRTYPDMYYAFRVEAGYAGFDLRALLQGVAGREVNIVNSASNKTRAFEDYATAYEIAKGRWTYYPDQGIDTRANATFPRLTTQHNENNYRASTFWMKNGDFLRLRNIEIGYTIPQHQLKTLNLSNVRVFVSGINLFTFSSLLKDYDLDPETLSGHPGVKSYNAGITIGF